MKIHIYISHQFVKRFNDLARITTIIKAIEAHSKHIRYNYCNSYLIPSDSFAIKIH